MNASMITKSSVATAVLACLLAAVAPRPALAAAPAAALEWPAPTAQNRPWTRWWWLGSAVDKANLTHQLTRFDQAGIGGVEICPIYGAKGFESAYLDFLSPAWMDMLNHTITQAARLDMGVDLTTGTGWPFGGPVITAETASAGLVLKQFEWTPEALARSLPAGTVQWVVARSDDGRRIDLTDQARQDRPDWTAPPGHWTVYAAAMKSPIQKVKRAAPGGAGYVVDPYSITALDAYLAVFDAAFAATPTPKPRAQFHDSFEYFGATWTADFLDAFKDRRGYDLADHLEALFGVGPEETVARILCDYHETINDLHLAYLRHWTKWCQQAAALPATRPMAPRPT